MNFTGIRRLTMAPVVKQISAGEDHTLIVMSNGSVYGWGLSDHGQLGFNGDTWVRRYLIKMPNVEGAIAVAAGYDHSLALLADGTVWAWGGNEHGQLGNGSYINSAVPTQVANLSGIISIAAGYHFSLALKNDGTIWGWGFNIYNQLGDDSRVTQTTPVKMLTENVVAIAAGKLHSLVLTSDGTARQWGFFPVSPGIFDYWLFTTFRGEPLLTDVIAIATKNFHDMFLKSDGTVWAWGANDYGQLGSGNREWDLTMVSDLNNVVAIAAGFHHSVAIKSDGTVWVWGGNGGGQLGIGTISLFEGKPVHVSTIADITAIGAGSNFISAADKYGKLWYWGLCGALDYSNYVHIYPTELTF